MADAGDTGFFPASADNPTRTHLTQTNSMTTLQHAPTSLIPSIVILKRALDPNISPRCVISNHCTGLSFAHAVIYFPLIRQCRMQEKAGLTDFPDAKGSPEHEIFSEPHLQFGGLGRLKLTVYRVGFQVQRELRNQFESWLRVGIAYDSEFREVLTLSDSTTRRRLRLPRECKWLSSPIEWSMAATLKTFTRTSRCPSMVLRYCHELQRPCRKLLLTLLVGTRGDI